MKKRLWLSAILVCLSFSGWTQGFVENGLLFSRTKPGGSARMQALGGAQVALGGDYSSALSNPAGLGFYNRSEFSFSPAINTYKVNSTHLGTKENSSSSKLNIPGLSLVYHYPKEQGKFLGGSFGVTMTRVNDFNTKFSYSGEDNFTSIIDYFLENANADFWDPRTELGYNTYLIEDSSYYSGGDPSQYFSVMGTYPDDPDDIRTQWRKESVIVKGAQYQWSFAYGGNFDDKLFFGASVGITSLRYKFKTTYREYGYTFDLDPSYDALDSLKMTETITIDGSGVNLTLGVIYRPVNFFQVGLSFVSPTYYEISDSYTADLTTYWNGFNYLDVGPLGAERSELDETIISEYTFTSPLKFSIGSAFFLGKYGFISGDVEFVNYGKAKYDSDISDISFSGDNNAIKSYYTNVVNYRLGAELRYEIFRLRGGYAHQSNPYKNNSYTDQSITTVSLGAGVKFTKFSIDFAWINSKGKSSYSPYAFQNGSGPVANLKNSVSSAMITVGYSF